VIDKSVSSPGSAARLKGTNKKLQVFACSFLFDEINAVEA